MDLTEAFWTRLRKGRGHQRRDGHGKEGALCGAMQQLGRHIAPKGLYKGRFKTKHFSFPFVAIFMFLLHGLLNIYLRDPFLKYLGIIG